MTTENIVRLAYLLASVLFIVGLKGLTHPRTAVRGNRLSALGMLIAVVAVLFQYEILSATEILIGVGIGTVLGIILATTVAMTSMPELVAAFNGFGGGASVLVAIVSVLPFIELGATEFPLLFTIPVAASVVIGAVTLSGSFIAFAKLKELMSGNPIRVPGGPFLNLLLLLASVGLSAWLCIEPNATALWALTGVATLLGIFLVVPIGGADMPVVVALLNSYSGLAASATGFVIGNSVLIISGSLVGASGLILTSIMCKAMNRSLPNVLFGVMGEGGETASADEVYAGKVKSTSPDEVAMMMDGVSRVVIVPGYGLAVAQAQHAIRDMANLLGERDVTVEYAIHPVAGRMPGHMNVLLAEADVPYDQLKEMDEINPTMETADLALVIGANDVVNPLARTDPNSPIAGMPVIDVDKARTVVVVKRSLSPGYAGIPNPLFAADNALMMFGDGKKAILELVSALKES